MDAATTMPTTGDIIGVIATALAVSLVLSVLLLARSAAHFTRTGPRIRQEILDHYKSYTIFATLRLTFWTFALSSLLTIFGVLVYAAWGIIAGLPLRWPEALAAALASHGALTFLLFCRHLLYMPSSIAASTQYRLSRLYPLWRLLSPARLLGAEVVLEGLSSLALVAASIRLATHGAHDQLVLLLGTALGLCAVVIWATWDPAPPPSARPRKRHGEHPNILLIGADTLRADRIGAIVDGVPLTPFIDSLRERGTLFANCYIPLARTAPSLASLFTGTWPHTHGIRSNYVPDDGLEIPVPTIVEIARDHGYHTATITDWSGADLGKLEFGFQDIDAPPDQWNLKFYIRQGPMDLRLFISLFTHNRFGRVFLPEIFYLAGVPLTGYLGRRTCTALRRMADRDEPFLLNVFMGTTHVPFGCEYPYYTMFTDRTYDGESKFVMSKFADPMEIIQKQGMDASVFDVEQILKLYNACVRRFDDEVRRIVTYLGKCGLAEDTVVVVYSDHGSDFFENGAWGQGNTVLGDDPSGRIPLLVIDPRRSGKGTIDDITRSIDVAPTLLELLGLPRPASFDGQSLMPFLDGLDTPTRLPAFQETGIWLTSVPGFDPDHLSYPNLLELLEVPDKSTGTLAIKREYAARIIEAKDRMIRTDRWKLVYQPMRSGIKLLLFDVEADPDCRTDVAKQHPDTVGRLRRTLDSWMCGDA